MIINFDMINDQSQASNEHLVNDKNTNDDKSKNTNANWNALSSDQIKLQLRAQLEFYFSRENLLHDKFLSSQMDQDQYVSVQTISSFNMIKKFNPTLESLIQAIEESPLLQLDSTKSKLRASSKRCVIILREIDENASMSEILDLFNSTDKCPKCLNCEFAGNRSWYITFKNEDDTLKAFQYLKINVQTFKDKPICARIKTHPIPRASNVTTDLAQNTTKITSLDETSSLMNIQNNSNLNESSLTMAATTSDDANDKSVQYIQSEYSVRPEFTNGLQYPQYYYTQQNGQPYFAQNIFMPPAYYTDSWNGYVSSYDTQPYIYYSGNDGRPYQNNNSYNTNNNYKQRYSNGTNTSLRLNGHNLYTKNNTNRLHNNYNSRHSSRRSYNTQYTSSQAQPNDYENEYYEQNEQVARNNYQYSNGTGIVSDRNETNHKESQETPTQVSDNGPPFDLNNNHLDTKATLIVPNKMNAHNKALISVSEQKVLVTENELLPLTSKIDPEPVDTLTSFTHDMKKSMQKLSFAEIVKQKAVLRQQQQQQQESNEIKQNILNDSIVTSTVKTNGHVNDKIQAKKLQISAIKKDFKQNQQSIPSSMTEKKTQNGHHSKPTTRNIDKSQMFKKNLN